MSGSESESLGAIVLNKNIMRSTNTAKKAAADSETTAKQCSACRHHKSIKEFVGSTPRHEGQEMRTCAECRERNRKIPLGNNSKESISYFREPRSAKRFEPVEVESGRNGRATRRQTTSPARAAMGHPSRSSSTARRPSTPFTMPITTRKSRNSLAAAAAAAATPVSTRASPERRASVTSLDEDNTDDTESDEEYYQPPPVLSSLKRRSTPPHSASEDVDQEDAIRVRPPAPKRQRIRAPSVVQREPEAEEAEEAEEGASALNADGNKVGSDLAAFATSLGRLSQLLIGAGKSLDNERIGALESEIHHDWRVDEMATFVEGFLKGASANTAGRGW